MPVTIPADFGTSPSYLHTGRDGEQEQSLAFSETCHSCLCNAFINCSFQPSRERATPFPGPLEPITHADVISQTPVNSDSWLRSSGAVFPNRLSGPGLTTEGGLKGCPLLAAALPLCAFHLETESLPSPSFAEGTR